MAGPFTSYIDAFSKASLRACMSHLRRCKSVSTAFWASTFKRNCCGACKSISADCLGDALALAMAARSKVELPVASASTMPARRKSSKSRTFKSSSAFEIILLSTFTLRALARACCNAARFLLSLAARSASRGSSGVSLRTSAVPFEPKTPSLESPICVSPPPVCVSIAYDDALSCRASTRPHPSAKEVALREPNKSCSPNFRLPSPAECEIRGPCRGFGMKHSLGMPPSGFECDEDARSEPRAAMPNNCGPRGFRFPLGTDRALEGLPRWIGYVLRRCRFKRL
mmetsp:Transcript_95249/g.269212  ORF Transcript_95249/g.269212 Transcript_95249/m.269212 type:complete len:284 (-) Transcript_95249:144-995(-)